MNRLFIASISSVMMFCAASTRGAEPMTLKLEQTIPLKGAAGRLDHMAVDRKHSRLFIANLSNNSLDVVDLKAAKLVKQLPDQKKIQGVAYVPDLNRIFVGNGVDGVCNVFDGDEFKLLKSIPLPKADNVRFNASTNLIYVGHAEHSISAIDAKTYEIKKTIKLPSQPEAFQLDAARSRLYVNTVKPAGVESVDLEKHEVLIQHPLTSAEDNYPMALDRENQRIYLGCRKPAKIVVMDAKSCKETASIEIPGDIDDLFLDAKRKRLYASCGDGFLTVIAVKSDDKLEIIEKIETPKLTRTCFFDPESDRLYVPTPRHEGKDDGPSLRVYKPKD